MRTAVSPAPPSVEADLDQGEARRRGSSVVAVMAVALVIATSFVGLRLVLHDGDPSVFVFAGDGVTDPATAPDELTVAPDSLGYDGQLFYRLARNPLTEGRREFGIELVRPEYRHQRIGYPVLAWLASGGGRPALLPWSMIAVNLGASVAIAGLAAAYARTVRRSVWWGLVAFGWAGFTVALARDLSEVVAGAFLLGALLLLRRRRWAAATAVLVLAALTRETTLLVPGAILLGHLLARIPSPLQRSSFAARPDGPPWWVGVGPLATFGLWRVLLRLWWGPDANGPEAPESFLVPPFTGLLSEVRSSVGQLADTVTLLQVTQVAILVTVVVLLASALRDREAGLPHERIALVAGIAFLTMMPEWGRSVVFLRWANDVVVVGLLVALTTRRVDLSRVAVLVGVMFALTAPVWASIA